VAEHEWTPSGAEAITAALLAPFPPQAIKTRSGGGGSSLSYVEGETVIRRLIKATGNRFDVKVLGFDAKPAGTTAPRDGKPGRPQTLLTATVELCVPGLGCRQHIGVQLTSEGGGEDLAKGAVTDAIKKAATLFGVGLELYGPDYEAAPAPAATKPVRRQNVAPDLGPPNQGALDPTGVVGEYHRRLVGAPDKQALIAVGKEMAASGIDDAGLTELFRRRKTAFQAAE
jgi:hypothetical protein